MVLLLAKNSKAECGFQPNFPKQVVIEIQKMEHPSKIFKVPPPPWVMRGHMILGLSPDLA